MKKTRGNDACKSSIVLTRPLSFLFPEFFLPICLLPITNAQSSASPTLTPTQAPTRACSNGEYRPDTGSSCVACQPGTYWNQSSETSACLSCPAGETSLQGATECYLPCQPNYALNTTDLQCVPIPEDLQDAVAANNISLNLNNTDVYIVTESLKLEETIAAVASTNETVVISLSPNIYPQQTAFVITTNLFIIRTSDPAAGAGRRRLGQHGRLLQPTDTYTDATLVAGPNSRHFVMAAGRRS